MSFRVLLADADGTLFDFARGEAVAISETLRRFGLPDDEETVSLYARANDAQWKKLERGETTSERVRLDRFVDFLTLGGFTGDPEAMCEDYVERLGRQRWVLPGAVDLLRAVSARMPVYLVTNGIARVQRSRLRGCEIEPYLTDVVISEEVGAPKPDPRMLHEALRRAGCRAEEALLLGDSVTADIAAANRAGIASILYTGGKPAPANSGATWTADTLEEACQIILR